MEANAIGIVVGLESRTEMNGIRVLLERWVDDRARWRVTRLDNGESLGVKMDNLAPEGEPGTLPAIISMLLSTDMGLIRVWLGSGGNIDGASRTHNGATLLMLACGNGLESIAEELIGRGAGVNARDDNGGSALLNSLHHPGIVRLLLKHGAHTNLQCFGEKTEGSKWPIPAVTPGTALENAERLGLSEAANAIREHEAKLASQPAAAQQPPRDVWQLEEDVLMRVLGATILARQAQLGDFKLSERNQWMQSLITTAFAEADDASSLSHRFSRHGANKLKLNVWSATASIETDRLSRKSGFKDIVGQLADQLPGLMEQLGGWSQALLTPGSRAQEYVEKMPRR